MAWGEVLSWIKEVPLCVAIPAFLAARALVIVVPPLQGWPLDVLAQQLWGWKAALVLAELGICTGAVAAYELGRLAKDKWLADSRLLAMVGEFERKFERRRWLLWTAIRLVSNPLFDPLSYLAGALAVPRPVYAVSTFLGTLPSMALFMWGLERFAREDWKNGVVFIVGFLVLVGLLAHKVVRSSEATSKKG